MYDIKYLLDTFTSHIQESDRLHEDTIKNFKENNPGQELPDWMKIEFSLPKALASICQEILDLKK